MDIQGRDIEELEKIEVVELKPGKNKKISRGDGLIIFVPLSGWGCIKEGENHHLRGWDLQVGTLTFYPKDSDTFLIINDSEQAKPLRVMVIKINRKK